MFPSFLTPVLLLVFNRPDQTEALIATLRGIRPARVYVHADGARAHVSGESEKVAAVREIIEQIDWPCAVETLYRTENKGLRAGVFGALEWFFEQEEQGIILEDDCLPDTTFFPFCAELLERYAENHEVMHIGGSNVAEKQTRHLPESYFFTKFSFVWGWATWRRAWQKMRLDLDGLAAFEAADSLANTLQNPMARAYLYDKFRATRSKQNNSWAYAWFYSILINKGLCIVPTRNLVQNTGIGDPNATHTQKADPRAAMRAGSLTFPLQHPTHQAVMPSLEQPLFYAAQKSRIRLTLWFLLLKLGLR